ncbi:MAG: hypothetical protein ACI4GC_09240 [Acutalibacteraceae bacterium]
MFDKLISKKVLLPLLGCSFVYGLILPFMWGNNPASSMGTLSLLCEDRKIWFWLWGILTSGSILLNAQYMYKKYNYKNKLLNVLSLLSFLSMCGVALTLGHSIEDWNMKRLLHWISTGLFIAFLIAAISLFFIFNIKRHNKFKVLTVLSFMILGCFGVLFAVMGKSAVMEMVPIALMQILLFTVNYTKVFDVDLK